MYSLIVISTQLTRSTGSKYPAFVAILRYGRISDRLSQDASAFNQFSSQSGGTLGKHGLCVRKEFSKRSLVTVATLPD